MLNVREVVPNSLIWFDEPEKETTKEESSDSDDLLAEDNEDKSPHENYRDLVSLQVKKEFSSLVPVQFISSKEKALTLIKSSVKTTLMVSGRAGIGLIDSLFEHDLTPASTISNIVIICNSKNKKTKLE